MGKQALSMEVTYPKVTQRVNGKVRAEGLPWWCSDQDSALPMQGSCFDPWSEN